MIPIQDLINRIKWDKEFGKGNFEIGYYDRVLDDIVRVSFREIHFDPGDHFSFELVDHDGENHSIPLHRVRVIFKDEEIIWERKKVEN